MTVLLVATFGAAGALSRYGIDRWAADFFDGDFPWGTWIVNLAGAFAIGVLVALTTERMIENEHWRIALGVGFLSSFTTFSTYAYDSVRLAEAGSLDLAFANAVGMLAAGIVLAFVGLAVGRAL